MTNFKNFTDMISENLGRASILNELAISDLKPDDPIVLYCMMGIRSVRGTKNSTETF